MTGTLKGYDQLLNLVLDEAVEFVRGIFYLTYIYCIDLVRLQFSSGIRLLVNESLYCYEVYYSGSYRCLHDAIGRYMEILIRRDCLIA